MCLGNEVRGRGECVCSGYSPQQLAGGEWGWGCSCAVSSGRSCWGSCLGGFSDNGCGRERWPQRRGLSNLLDKWLNWLAQTASLSAGPP